jgi:hypothetical protein
MNSEEMGLLQEEGMVHQQMIQWFKAKLSAQPGRIYITRKRIVVEYSGNPMAGILLKALFKSQGARVVFNSLISDIVGIEKEKFGMNQVTLITDRQGHQVRIGGMSVEDMEREIRNGGGGKSW